LVEDIEVRVRVRVPEEDKQEIRNQAQAIRDAGSAPIQRDPTSRGFGVFFEGSQDPGVLGFERRQSLSGGVRSPFRDRTSAAPFQRTSTFSELANKVDNIEDMISTPEQLQKLIGIEPTDFQNLINIARNPEGFLLQFLNIAKLPLAIITAALSAPQAVNAFVSFLKSRRAIGVFRREIQRELNPFLSREEQRSRQLGETLVIATQFRGFGANPRILTGNTLSQVRANGISDIGLRDKAGGLF